ncbi:WD40 repeat domain-containing protein [Candidatus Frankia nodulisporulans]|uniref:WD40 repeat domain-containing protein n=1 Tax=Candidatus Frankia nodulisporulans TaxID=2060052 RepID=UPI003704CDF6
MEQGKASPRTPADRVRRGRRWLALVAVVLVAVLVGAIVLIEGRDKGGADVADVPPAVAVQAITRQATDPGLASRLALAAYRAAPTSTRTQEAMIAAFGENLPPVAVDSGSADIRSMAISRDGKLVAVGGADGVITMWEVTDRTRLQRRDSVRTTGWVDSMTFNSDGKLLATGSADGSVRLWDAHDPTNLRRLSITQRHTDTVRAVAFTPDGNTLASSGTDGTLALWDITDPANPTIRSHFETATGGVYAVAFAPKGGILATAGEDATIRLWNITDAAHPVGGLVLRGHSRAVQTLAYTADGATLITGGVDATVQLWNVAIRDQAISLRNIPGQLGGVTAVAVSRSIVASGGDAEVIRLAGITDPTDPVPLANWHGPTRSITAVGFVGDSGVVLAAAHDGTLRLWDADPAHLATAACTDPANRISPAEWSTFFGSMDYRPPC